MKAVTLATLLADVRALYEIRSISLDDTLLTRWINQSYSKLYDLIISVAPEHFRSSDTINLVSGTYTYALSSEIADFYKGMGADVLLESGYYNPMGTFPWEERHIYAGNVTTSRADLLYCYMGDKMHLIPVPGWTNTAGIQVWYIPTPTVLVGGGSPNTIDTFNSWDEYIVADVCRKCAIKEEAPTKDLVELSRELKADILVAAKQRDFAHSQSIRSVSQSRARDPFKNLPPPA